MDMSVPPNIKPNIKKIASSKTVIALDAMGGDFGPHSVVPGADMALKARPDASFLFYGDERAIKPILDHYPDLIRRSDICHTDQVITGDEKPSTALRRGRQSSMRLAIDAVANKTAQGIVSSGNTGALMATAKLVLRALPQIHRPAISSVFPNMRGRQTVMLDLGANVKADSENLAQFAVLGAIYARLILGIETPSVGILNVGSEEMKGNDRVRSAAAILGHVDFPGRYYGFVEGNDVSKGTVDVVVTDGFTGNISLKMAEGVSHMIIDTMKEAFQSSLLAKIGYLFAMPALKKMKLKLDPRAYNGGIFMGLNGICIKSHGNSDAFGFSCATIRAIDLVSSDFNERAVQQIDYLINQEFFFSQDHEEDMSL